MMDPRMARSILKPLWHKAKMEDSDTRMAIVEAIKALEKQIPKKPETKSSEHGDTESCSWCGAIICWAGEYDLSDGVYPEYCRMCGQKLDWEDE